MGRYTGSNVHSHRLRQLGPDTWRISWTIDRYYPSSQLRHPQTYQRITDDLGAKRFAKKHGIEIPPPPDHPPH